MKYVRILSILPVFGNIKYKAKAYVIVEFEEKTDHKMLYLTNNLNIRNSKDRQTIENEIVKVFYPETLI